MKPIKLAVLSDLHVGEKSRAKDFRPTDTGRMGDVDYKKNFLEFISKKKISADYLIIPGDITNKAQPNEFRLASQIVSEIARAFSINDNKIIFVPGNHDADWMPMKNDPTDKTGFRKAQRYEPICLEALIFEKIMRKAKRHMFRKPDFSWWEFKDLLVLGYNSSWHDGPETHIHHGLIANESLNEIEKCLQKIDLAHDRLRLFLVHHHPLQYSNPIPNEPDFSIMTNSGNLIDLLTKYHFDLLIHGHKHVPYFCSQIKDSGFPLVILCAGSFSAEIEIQWNGIVNNQFHLINISDRDKNNKCIYGDVSSWTYIVSQGWIPSYTYTKLQSMGY